MKYYHLDNRNRWFLLFFEPRRSGPNYSDLAGVENAHEEICGASRLFGDRILDVYTQGCEAKKALELKPSIEAALTLRGAMPYFEEDRISPVGAAAARARISEETPIPDAGRCRES